MDYKSQSIKLIKYNHATGKDAHSTGEQKDNVLMSLRK